MALVVLIVVAFFVHGVAGNMQCEDLPTEMCSFSVTSAGNRCVLENHPTRDGMMRLECKTSPVVVEFLQGWIETEQCVNACGLDRNTTGFKSDALLQCGFITKLCAPACYNNCPNVIDLYFNLALAKGDIFPEMCKSHRVNLKRAMIELSSSGIEISPFPMIADRPTSSGQIISSSSSPAESPTSITISL